MRSVLWNAPVYRHIECERLTLCDPGASRKGVHFCPISRFRPILAHHDDRGLQGREAREDQVHQDKGIGIEGAGREDDGVDDDPNEEDRPEDHDERPAAAKRCDPVGKMLPKSQLLLKFLPDIFGKDLVLLQAVDDFLVERGQFPDLRLAELL